MDTKWLVIAQVKTLDYRSDRGLQLSLSVVPCFGALNAATLVDPQGLHGWGQTIHHKVGGSIDSQVFAPSDAQWVVCHGKLIIRRRYDGLSLLID